MAEDKSIEAVLYSRQVNGKPDNSTDEGKISSDQHEENTINEQETATGENHADHANNGILTILSSSKKKKKRNTRPAAQRGYVSNAPANF